MIDNTAFGTVVDGDTLRFERLLPGPIERVWDYLTQTDLLARWLGPIDIPPTPGARFSHQWEGGGRLDGCVRAYDPPFALEYDWVETSAPGGPIRDTVVRFELTPDSGHVRLVLTHRAIARTAFATLGAGWHAHLDALAARLEGSAPVDPDERYGDIEPHYATRFP